MKNKFLVLWLAGILSTILGLPYIFTLQRSIIESSPLSLPVLVLVSVLQTAVILAVAIFFGLKLAQRIGLPAFVLFEPGAPVKENLKRIIKLGVPLGVAVGLIIKFADFFFYQSLPQLMAASEEIPFLKALLVAPYGGVVEELLLRLFVVSLFAWLLGKIFKTTEVIKNSTIMWTAIIAAAILFGLGHLPATASIVPLTSIVVFRAILLNGIGGVVFGWLYWKKGLEYAIAAHFTADIVLHAILPAVMK